MPIYISLHFLVTRLEVDPSSVDCCFRAICTNYISGLGGIIGGWVEPWRLKDIIARTYCDVIESEKLY
ncbi:hypothetical protein Hanom_Chr02g00163881 [Helianthus anomalus]